MLTAIKHFWNKPVHQQLNSLERFIISKEIEKVAAKYFRISHQI